MGNDGSKVKARYSFIYIYEDDEWKIAHHHSSVMPEAFLGSATPSKEKAVNGRKV
jgi:ketosteroid isomerase-like protein